jgi:hypothetical protein
VALRQSTWAFIGPIVAVEHQVANVQQLDALVQAGKGVLRATFRKRPTIKVKTFSTIFLFFYFFYFLTIFSFSSENGQ